MPTKIIKNCLCCETPDPCCGDKWPAISGGGGSGGDGTWPVKLFATFTIPGANQNPCPPGVFPTNGQVIELDYNPCIGLGAFFCLAGWQHAGGCNGVGLILLCLADGLDLSGSLNGWFINDRGAGAFGNSGGTVAGGGCGCLQGNSAIPPNCVGYPPSRGPVRGPPVPVYPSPKLRDCANYSPIVWTYKGVRITSGGCPVVGNSCFADITISQ